MSASALARAVSTLFGLLCVTALVLGAGRLLERVFDLSLPTPVAAPPPAFWAVALVTGWLAGALGRAGGAGED